MKHVLTKKGFSLVELLIVIALLAILGVGTYIGLTGSQDSVMNEKVAADLLAIENALNQYNENEGVFPTFENPIELGKNRNIRCFDAFDNYTHKCEEASYLQTQIDNQLLTKRYLQEIPTDPRSNTRYTYSVTTDGKFFQVAGNEVNEEGEWVARVIGNLNENTLKTSLIQAFDSSNRVANGEKSLPYSPNSLDISGRIQEAIGSVTLNGEVISEKTVAMAGDMIKTGPESSAILYLSDGSVSHLSENTQLQILPNTEVTENDEDNISSKVRLKLFEGEIWNKVIHLSSESEFNVETTNAIAGVRGTEFGLNADNDTITMLSGTVAARLKTDEEKSMSNGEGQFLEFSVDDFNADQEASADGETMKRYKIPVGNGVELSQNEQSEILEKYYEDNTGITSADIPYIKKAVAHPNGSYSLYITFNGLNGKNGVEASSFNIFSESQMADVRTLKEASEAIYQTDLDNIEMQYDEQEQAYVFDIPYRKKADDPLYNAEKTAMESIIVQGAMNELESGLSWPPLGLEPDPNEEYSYEFGADFYPEFSEVEIAKVIDIAITNDEDRMAAGEGSQFKTVAVANYNDGTAIEITDKCEWSVANENLGEINLENGVFSVSDPKSEGAQGIICKFEDFTATHEISILPSLMASCFGLNLINDQGKEDDNGLWQQGSCWVLGDLGQSCDLACENLAGTAQCDPDPNWNDCGPDGICEGDGAADDAPICSLLIGSIPQKIKYDQNNFAPYYFLPAKTCFSRRDPENNKAECSKETNSENENRICKCI